MRHLSYVLLIVMLGLCVHAVWARELPPNLARQGRIEATSSASAPDGTYGIQRALDGNSATRWASADRAALPQKITITFDKPVNIDTVFVTPFVQANLYDAWSRYRILLDGKVLAEGDLRADDQTILQRFAARPVTRFELEILATHTRTHYVGISELGLYRDPDKVVKGAFRLPHPLLQAELRILGRKDHPCVNIDRDDVERARRNIKDFAWARDYYQSIRKDADRWLEHPAAYWLQFLPKPGACHAYGFTGCPICGASWGTWGGARCSWDKPGKVTCANGHVLPDAAHPDPGTGYKSPDGRIHYFVGSWNAWVTEQWTLDAIPNLSLVYVISGEDKYAELASALLDGLASIYSESTSGSWDYPSDPPSGRLARPWYQVARTLVWYVDEYDCLYNYPGLAKPSLRPGLTRRQDIEQHLLEDGGYYCYEHSFSGLLHNGHADYMRGALAVGCLLGIPEYVHNAVESPYSIYSMIANNCDRDGRYYETSLGYALHARNLYLTFADPLRYYHDEKYPHGINLYDNARFRSFYRLPSLTMDCAGHSPNFGDSAPDNRQVFPAAQPYDPVDYNFAEQVLADATKPEVKREFAAYVKLLSGGNVDTRRAAAGDRRWLLFHADPLPADAGQPSTDMQRRLFQSYNLGQKGIAILRDGAGADAQAALLRYGPTLNHGDPDELGLLYYAKGWQLTYDIGYGLASTHTQVGWASATVSHTTVCVDETNQLHADGSGGSLHLFASVPGLQLVEVSAPLAYSSEKVSQYRRTVALVGDGKDQVLVDFFRARGGHEHDYVVGSQGQEQTTAGVQLGAPEPGSLAGPDISWGTKQGNDGDIIGYPNKPYWNPPPGNGYGFLYDVRRATTEGPWTSEWRLDGGNDAHFLLHLLCSAGDEAIVARAPGLYPFNHKASYAIWRRKGDNLTSTFVSVMEPEAKRPLPGHINAAELQTRVAASRGEIKAIPELGVLLLKGTGAGDFVEFTLPVKEAGDYALRLEVRRANSYGAAAAALDGKPVGQVDAYSANLTDPVTIDLGVHKLTAGNHSFRLTMLPAPRQPAAYFLGIAGVAIVPAADIESAGAPMAALKSEKRLPVTCGANSTLDPAAVRLERPDGTVQVVISSAVENGPVTVDTDFGRVELDGAFVLLTGRSNRLSSVSGCAVRSLRVNGKPVSLPTSLFDGEVADVDTVRNAVRLTGVPASIPNGSTVIFNRPGYSRNTAYHIDSVKPATAGAELNFGDTPLTLGIGQVADIVDSHTIITNIPHEYCRKILGGVNSRFFEGKRLVAKSGAATRIRSVQFGPPMQLTVESANGFAVGDIVTYEDVQRGDTARIVAGFRVDLKD